jgi:hypothetical protein
MRICKAKDCNRKIDDEYIYCSYECACYDGSFSVTKGWLKTEEELEKMKNEGAISSAGTEHLPYKQGVTGSNPVSPTILTKE